MYHVQNIFGKVCCPKPVYDLKSSDEWAQKRYLEIKGNHPEAKLYRRKKNEALCIVYKMKAGENLAG